jgi:hypothetical protein
MTIGPQRREALLVGSKRFVTYYFRLIPLSIRFFVQRALFPRRSSRMQLSSQQTFHTQNPASNHHDGELSPPMMKGACGGVSGRVPVRETSSEAAVLSLAYFLTPFTVTGEHG